MCELANKENNVWFNWFNLLKEKGINRVRIWGKFMLDSYINDIKSFEKSFINRRSMIKPLKF